MRNKMQRIFAFVLVLAMLLAVLPINATAADHEHIKQTENDTISGSNGDAGYRSADRGPTRDENPRYYRIDGEEDFASDVYVFIVDGPADDENYTNYALLISQDANKKAGMLASPAKFDSTPDIITAGSALAWYVYYSNGQWTIRDANGNYLVDTTDSEGYGLELSTTADTTWSVKENGEDKFVITSSEGNVISLRSDITDLKGSNGHPLFSMASNTSVGCAYFNVYKQECPHTYAYASKYDGTHDRYCTICGSYENFACTMSNGQCTVCGYDGDHTLSFIVPDGVDPIEPIVGSRIAPPAPHGAPASNPENATFIGWTNKIVDHETEKPTIYYPGRVYNLPEDVTLVALYAYADSMTFTLFDGTSTLALGDRIAIVAREYDYAMSKTQNSNNRASAPIVKNENTFTVSSDDNIAVLNVSYGVHGSDETTQYSFHDGTGYLAACSSSKNYLRTVAELDENSTWTYAIDATTYAATVNAKGEFARNTIRYNASNNPALFSCYDPSNSTLRDIQIYKLTSESGVVYTTEFPASCEHIFTYETNDNGTHMAICANCGYSEENDCDLTEGTCPDCGYTEVLEYTVSFVVPAGVNEIDPITASELVLPSPSGTPDFNYNDAMFIGWTFEPVDNSDEMPPVLNTTTAYPITEDMTLYALYSYSNSGSVFTLYDGSDDLAAGDKAIIVAKDYDFAISGTQNTNNRVAAAVTKDGKNITVTNADNIQILTIEDGAINGTIAFATGSGYLSAASNSGNYLRTSEVLDENSSWAYILDENTNELALTAQGSYTRNTLRFNKSSSVFACYTAANSQYAVQLYICTVAGGTIYTTEFSEDACSHEYNYTSNGDGTHIVQCGKCDAIFEEDCDLTDGACPSCGYEKECIHEFVYSSNGDGTHLVECGNCDYIGKEDCDLADGACPSCGYEKECIHEFVYSSNGDGTHSVECVGCDYIGQEDCDLTDGACPFCGYEEIREYTLSFVVPTGVNAIEPITGTSAIFPTPTGTPNNNYHNATFVGWTTEILEDSVQVPFIYEAGTEYDIESDMTVYALYSYIGAGASYTLFDGSDDLDEGVQAIIVAKDYNYAISTQQNTNNRAVAEVSKNGNTVSFAAGSEVAVFTIKSGMIDGTIAFKDEQGYLRSASSTGNQLRTSTTLDEAASWSYSIDPLDAAITLTAQGSFTRNTIRYNKSSNLFACYAADNANQFAVQLYTASGDSAQIYTTVFSTACPHTSVTTDIKDPTCTNDGYRKETCDICGAVILDQILEAFGHDYTAVVTKPTCITEGYTTYTCLECGSSFVDDYVSAGNHDYVGVTTKPATCTEDGIIVYTCSACDASYTDTLAAFGHDYTATVFEPTCGEQGYTNYSCLICGDSFEDDFVESTGDHDYGGTVVPPTCASQGYTIYTCMACGYSFNDDYVEADPDMHDYAAEVVPPTCKDQGYTVYTCVCGDTFTDDYVPVSSHNYVSTVVEATCLEYGYTLYVCSFCETSYKGNYTPKTEHSFVYTDNGETHTVTCENCNYSEQSEHSWNEGNVVTTPSCGVDGVIVYTCTVCKAENTVVIDSPEHAVSLVPEVPATCTASGVMAHFKCPSCGKIYLDENCTYELPAEYIVVSPLGHYYIYERLNASVHTLICTNGCNLNTTEAHEFENGKCICGEFMSTDPIVDKALTFNMAVTVGVEMSVGYSFMAQPLDKYESFYLEVSKTVANGDPVVTVYNVADFDVIKNPSTGEVVMYKVTYKGINAKEMGDEFRTTLYAVDANGIKYCSATKAASIKSSLIEKMSAANATAELKTMAIDMLKYGAAAQVRLSYNTANLVTDDLTAEQMSYGTQEIPAAVDKSATFGGGATVNAAITVGSKVELGISTILTNVSAPENLKCVVIDEKGMILATLDTTVKHNVAFSAKYGNVGAREMRKVINVTFFDNGTAVSQTMSWSVESYVAQIRAKANVSDAELNMVNTMLAYGDAVAAYLDSTGQ